MATPAPWIAAPDRKAAEAMVDHALDYVGANERYRAANREHMVREHIRWCRFEREMREAKAAKAAARRAAA